MGRAFLPRGRSLPRNGLRGTAEAVRPGAAIVAMLCFGACLDVLMTYNVFYESSTPLGLDRGIAPRDACPSLACAATHRVAPPA